MTTTSDTTAQVEHSAFHSPVYHALGSAMMSFQPVNQIHQHLCALHVYASDSSRSIRAHHFCTHIRHDMHQCIIYDSDQPNARLIGIEYVIEEPTFVALPEEEKKFWHSHKYEVESGMLILASKSLVPNAINDIAERPAMLELHRTYGKTIHTWQPDVSPELPLGPPHLMMAYVRDDQVDTARLKNRDDTMGYSTEAKRALRDNYLPKERKEKPVAAGCDVYVDGKRGHWEWVEDN